MSTPPALPPRYEQALSWLLGLEAARGMDFKLERVRAALDAIGSPHDRYRTIHIAGTNGKGSVAAMAASILRASGRRTGLYTSPHLVDFRERIRVDGAWISADEVADGIAEIRASVDVEGSGLTFFEIATVLALSHFARRQVDVGVLEVGLGGRLDATNVVDADVGVITSIGYAHEAFLGSTLEQIAAEKAGILKPGQRGIVGELEPNVRSVIVARATHVGAPLWLFGSDVHTAGSIESLSVRLPHRELDGLSLPLVGRHQRHNAALAVAAVDALTGGAVTDDAFRAGLASARWPGRLERVSERPLVVLDAAHNVESARVLAAEIGALVGSRRVHLVFGVLADKRWREMVEVVAPLAARTTVTRPPIARAEDPAIVAACFQRYCPTDVVADPGQAVRRALGVVGSDEAIVVAGSIFLVGAVYPIFEESRARLAGGS